MSNTFSKQYSNNGEDGYITSCLYYFNLLQLENQILLL